MNWSAILYLGLTFSMFAIFAVIVFRTYRKNRKDKMENPKYRMLDDD